MLLDNIAIHSLWKVFRQRLYNIVFRQVLTKSIFSLLDGKNDQKHQEPKIESVLACWMVKTTNGKPNPKT